MQWSSSFANNALILSRSPRASELNVGHRFDEDLAQLQTAGRPVSDLMQRSWGHSSTGDGLCQPDEALRWLPRAVLPSSAKGRRGAAFRKREW